MKIKWLKGEENLSDPYYVRREVFIKEQNIDEDLEWDGRVLVENMMAKAFEMGAEEIHVHAQTRVRGFYEKLGFEAYGDTYEEAGIEHISMKAVRAK